MTPGEGAMALLSVAFLWLTVWVLLRFVDDVAERDRARRERARADARYRRLLDGRWTR